MARRANPRRDRQRALERTVTKASGAIEPFVPSKLKASLRRAGADDLVIRLILDRIEDNFVPAISTQGLYRMAHEELRRMQRPAAARYSLRRATLALGPSGYPFEHLIAALFASHGHTTQVGRLLQGRCVRHEVDVVAMQHRVRTLVECKFHSRLGFRTDVKIALYVRARALDLEENPANAVKAFWLVTNAKFTSEALKYGTCSGLELLGWDHPQGDGLQERLERARVVPLTCSTTLKATVKRRLLDAGIVTIREVLARPEVLGPAGVRDVEADRVLTEFRALEAATARPPPMEADRPGDGARSAR
jgi:hypothetical protein